jgi:hypothetical protein
MFRSPGKQQLRGWAHPFAACTLPEDNYIPGEVVPG